MAQALADTAQRREKMVLSTRNDLGVEVREKATALLNQHLADATDLYSQTKQAHGRARAMSLGQWPRAESVRWGFPVLIQNAI